MSGTETATQQQIYNELDFFICAEHIWIAVWGNLPAYVCAWSSVCNKAWRSTPAACLTAVLKFMWTIPMKLSFVPCKKALKEMLGDTKMFSDALSFRRSPQKCFKRCFQMHNNIRHNLSGPSMLCSHQRLFPLIINVQSKAFQKSFELFF